MKKLLIIILIFCWPLSVRAWPAKVVSVTDGDTVKVFNAEYGQVKIRLYGIDSPEKEQAFGQAARKYLASLIAGVTVEIDPVTTDSYGRTVAVVWEGKRNLNEQMISAGYAWVYTRYCQRAFCFDWVDLEEKARNDKMGLWHEPEPVPPWEWKWKHNAGR